MKGFHHGSLKILFVVHSSCRSLFYVDKRSNVIVKDGFISRVSSVSMKETNIWFTGTSYITNESL